MRVLLVAVNAKFSHTNLAVRYLRDALAREGIPARIAEFTINQQPGEILAGILRERPDRLLVSCYLWNITLVRRVCADFKLLCPDTPIILGGPEVSFDPEEQLAALPWADALIAGEGEPVVAGAVRAPRGVYRAAGYADLDALPFPYAELDGLQNRVLYYESSRGCPFGCAYCLSSADRTARFRSLPLVFGDLGRFLDARVMQVKFVDRTFNLDAARALAIWRYLIDHDNGHTSFQMELGGDLTTPEQRELLAGARPGLFQFEVGVQSTCPGTLEKICRKTDLGRLRENVRGIRSVGNIHQHLDLIAGLPEESFDRFAESFDEVIGMRPEQLQLGFLKLLRGSSLYARRAEYGLVHSEAPPYEVLRTPRLTFGELTRLKTVEAMTETYYNSGRFARTLEYLFSLSDSPFETLLALGEGLPARSVGKYEYYECLYAFCVARGGDPERSRWLLKYDLCLHERPRKLPACCAGTEPDAQTRRAFARLNLPKMVHPEWFPFDVTAPEPGGGAAETGTALCFDYARRDLMGRARCVKMTL